MSLELPTPEKFPAFPYSPPYPIQVELMRHLYAAIERRQVAIVESPTGTGKTLSLLCSSITWLNDEKNRARKGKLEELSGPGEPDDWVYEQTREKARRELEDAEREYEERLASARRREQAQKAKMRARVVKKPRMLDVAKDLEEDESFLPESEADEDDNLSPAVKALMAKFNKSSHQQNTEDPTCTKIYYASRTHSQLTQVLPELQRLKISHRRVDELPSSERPSNKRKRYESEENAEPSVSSRTVSLGSRKHLCINDDLRTKASDIDEACRELLSEKGDRRCQYLPPLEEDHILNDFRDQILASPKDIEDLANAGRMANVCPYFGSRRAIPQAELVTLPYNLLLQKNSREALGIDLKNQIVIIDEAHNLISTLLSLSTTRLTLQTLQTSFAQVGVYVSKFRNRLSAQNMLHLKRLVAFLDALRKYLSEWKTNNLSSSRKAEVLNTAELLGRLGRRIVGLNMLAIEQYLKSSKIARKIAGYAEKVSEKDAGSQQRSSRSGKGAVPPLHAVEDLLFSLAGATEDGRVTLSLEGAKGQEEVVIKYQLLNPAPHFREVVNSARSVILAGGTMSPMSDIVDQLFFHLPIERISTFSCGHIINSSNLLTLAVTKGPHGGELDYKVGQQKNPDVIAELASILLNFTHQIPAGMVVFFPSYNFLNTSKDVWSKSGVLNKLSAKKRIFFEPDDSANVELVLQEYASAVQNCTTKPGGALLFAVIGAKLSEGLNFSDDLARAVIVIGLPFANLGSVELQERMKYVKRLEQNRAVPRQPGMKDAAAELYENMCMNAVNQSIGRAIRHRGDWAALILLDQRYQTATISKKLPCWIGGNLKVAQSFGNAVKELGTFFRNRRQ
ncbi:chl1 helicase [Moniliophthora roreri MCA 2997]|uniref:ATP-dependent DNA helicase CHL1 n=1 Tax=Moniliophthora roreri (strain MCA 2997) TaxID=1381753 RepID=V2YVT3_MONRO|nr:chl1 helicase [Moniliophthora roreri MCA 2997]KAI3616261.1 chl1 helicase [Moniliophthora roreri]